MAWDNKSLYSTLFVEKNRSRQEAKSAFKFKLVTPSCGYQISAPSVQHGAMQNIQSIYANCLGPRQIALCKVLPHRLLAKEANLMGTLV